MSTTEKYNIALSKMQRKIGYLLWAKESRMHFWASVSVQETTYIT